MDTSMAYSALPRVADTVFHRELPNGLTLLIKENHTAPVAALFVFVKIGYFHEPDRLTGITHVIEHMMFKGTPARPEDEQYAREIRELGGILNASTYYEETGYYVVVPSEHLEKAMEIQADALRNARFDAAELAKEIEVIVQESLQKRDNPNAMLIESLYALAFDRHRIRRWRMGLPETLRALTREDLMAFVTQTYRPENMIVAIVGAVDLAQVEALVHRYWGDLSREGYYKEPAPVEPARDGFRFQRLLGATQQRLFAFALPAPDILSEDAPALMVLTAILSDGRSARLYRRLKEELQIANSAWASYEGFETLGVLLLGGESIGEDPLAVETALWQEVTRLQREPVAADDLERIKARIQSRRLYAQEDVLGVARTLANYQSLGDYRLADTLPERLAAVTPAEVQRVAQHWLQRSQASLLEFLPETEAVPKRTPAEIEAALQEAERALPQPTLPSAHPMRSGSAFEPERIELPGGMTLTYRQRSDLPLVAFNVLFRGGRLQEQPGTSGLTSLMVKTALKGTRSYRAEQIAHQVEALGTSIGTTVSGDYFGYGMKVQKSALREAFALFAEVVAGPVFSEEEVAREQQTLAAEIRRQQDSNSALAFDLVAAACYGATAYGLPAVGIEAAIRKQTGVDLHHWHRQEQFAGGCAVGIVGDLSIAEAVAMFTDLVTVRADYGAVPPIRDNTGLTSLPYGERILEKQKQQTAAALAFRGASLGNPDRYALDVLAEIASGMGGRFFRAVRGENALAYQVAGLHRSRGHNGNFYAYTSTAPENERRARELLLDECARLGREPVSAVELATAKAALVGAYVIGTQTFGAQAGELAVLGVYDLPLDQPRRYLERIQAITAEEVCNVARRYLDPSGYWLGVVRGTLSK